MKPFWVYILHCADGSYYTGHTDNLELRISQHQAGTCEGYTATRRPVKLVWSQECATREEALAAELQIKGWSRKKKEAMMRGDWAEVSRLARSKSSTSVRPESFGSAQDRLVEGRFSVSPQTEDGESSPARSKSVHASTSSARTDLLAEAREYPQKPVRPESFGSAQDRLVEGREERTTYPVHPELVEGRDRSEESEDYN